MEEEEANAAPGTANSQAKKKYDNKKQIKKEETKRNASKPGPMGMNLSDPHLNPESYFADEWGAPGPGPMGGTPMPFMGFGGGQPPPFLGPFGFPRPMGMMAPSNPVGGVRKGFGRFDGPQGIRRFGGFQFVAQGPGFFPRGPGPGAFGGPFGFGPPPGPFMAMYGPGNPKQAKTLNKDDKLVMKKHSDIIIDTKDLEKLETLAAHTEKALEKIAKTEAEFKNTFENLVRVGELIKGLLLDGDRAVNLVFLTKEPPTKELLERLATSVKAQTDKMYPEANYQVKHFPKTLIFDRKVRSFHSSRSTLSTKRPAFALCPLQRSTGSIRML